MDSSKDILEKGTILKGLGFCITWMIKNLNQQLVLLFWMTAAGML
jgi:hypothetical protein